MHLLIIAILSAGAGATLGIALYRSRLTAFGGASRRDLSAPSSGSLIPKESGGIQLPGWDCPKCRCFNGEAKELLHECRSCGLKYIRPTVEKGV